VELGLRLSSQDIIIILPQSNIDLDQSQPEISRAD